MQMINNLKKYSSHPLQSPEWGEFRKEWGNEVVKTSNQQIVFSKIPKTSLTIGTSLKGPSPTINSLKELKDLGKKEKAIFIKLEPNVAVTDQKLLKKYCVKGKTLFTPTTFWIDLTRPEDEILKSFSPKTRYNIRLAQRKGVVVKEDNSDKAFEKYLQLMGETVKRQNFFAHSKKYHRLMWKYLYPEIAHLLTARFNPPSRKASEGQVITAWILFIYKDFIYYPYGASSDKYKNVMANNLMMWEAIKLGKKLGCKTFDLWGREPGKGFTKFKEGYNPKVVEFIGSWDLVINPFLYWPYRILEYFRWFLLKVPVKLGLIKPKF